LIAPEPTPSQSMAEDALRAGPEALRAPRTDPLAAPLPAASPARPEADPATCLVCGQPLRNRRPEARCCGGRCRATLSRQTRARELAVRVRRAEAALREAADALADLREFAVGLGVPLQVETATS
jgi:hypothetical protein